MGAATAAVAVVSTVMNIAAAQQRGASQRRALKGQALVRAKQSDEVLRQTQRKLSVFDRKSDVFFGDQVSRFAKAGVDLSGSALLNLADTRREIEVQRNDIETTGIQESNLLLSGASAARGQARAAGRATDLAVAGSVLGGVAQIANIAGGSE